MSEGLPPRPDPDLYRQALEDARYLAEEAGGFFAKEGKKIKVEIVFTNPTVKEYRVTIVPGP
jgi:hypothetical protein